MGHSALVSLFGEFYIQTPKKGPTYYREDSHLRGYRDCSDISKSVRASVIDEQVAELVKSLKLSGIGSNLCVA